VTRSTTTPYESTVAVARATAAAAAAATAAARRDGRIGLRPDVAATPATLRNSEKEEIFGKRIWPLCVFPLVPRRSA